MPRADAIDLNADLGEGYGPWVMGDDAAMLSIVTSASVACGGHAGDPETMYRTLTLARERGISVGAHPSYPDKEGFGRRRLPTAPAEVERFVAAQVGALAAIGALAGLRLAYVKPHGALSNVACEEPAVADAIMRSVRAVDPALPVLAVSGTELERSAERHGVACFSEIFADRTYTAQGLLTPRSRPDALIHDPQAASARLLRWLQTGRMPTVDGDEIALEGQSICIHGDSPQAVDMARTLRGDLEAAGVLIRPFA